MGEIKHTPQPITTSTPPPLHYLDATGATKAGLTQRSPDVDIDLRRVVTYSSLPSDEYAVRLRPPTYAATSPQAANWAATLFIEGPPVAGTNVTINDPAALAIQSGAALFANGSPAKPAISFLSDRDVGWGLAATNQIFYSAGGNSVGFWGTFGRQWKPQPQTSPIFNLPWELDLTTAAHTGQSGEAIDARFNLARTVTFVGGGGALNVQRAILIQQPTYAAAAAQSINEAATLAVTGAPVQGSNVTLVNSYAFWVQAGKTKLAERLEVEATGGSTGGIVHFELDLTGAGHTALAGEVHDVEFDLARTVTFTGGGGAIAWQRSVFIDNATYAAGAAQTITDAATVYIDGPPVAGANMTLTNSYALYANGATYINGKLTVTGAIDPTALILSTGTDLYIQSDTGTAAVVAPANKGRLRYNDTLKCWQASVDTNPYECIATSGPQGASGGELYQFGNNLGVPGSGTLGLLGAGDAVSGYACNRAGTIVGASISVDASDATNTYNLSIRVNGVQQATVTLNTGNTVAYSAALNVSVSAGDVISVAVVRTAGAGPSAFNDTAATVEAKF
jgi:hypothetical protein